MSALSHYSRHHCLSVACAFLLSSTNWKVDDPAHRVYTIVNLSGCGIVAPEQGAFTRGLTVFS